MSLLHYNEEENIYIVKIDGVEVVCEEARPELEKTAAALAEAYQEKLPELVAFMMDDITGMFGEITEEELANALGTPRIDLDRETVAYLEQTLDDVHLIEIEFGGLFDEFYEVIIDG